MRGQLSIAIALAVASVQSPAHGQATAPATTIPPGFSMGKRNVLVHEASGTKFPASAAGFVRFYEDSVGDTGTNAVVSYRRTIGGAPVIARFAVFHIEGVTAQLHFISMKSSVGTYFQGQTFSDVELISEGPYDFSGVKKGAAYQGRFTAKLGEVPYELSLTTVDFGYWDGRLTAAYPAAYGGASRSALKQLVEKIEDGWSRRE